MPCIQAAGPFPTEQCTLKEPSGSDITVIKIFTLVWSFTIPTNVPRSKRNTTHLRFYAKSCRIEKLEYIQIVERSAGSMRALPTTYFQKSMLRCIRIQTPQICES